MQKHLEQIKALMSQTKRVKTPALNRARQQALMGRNPSEQLKMIAAQPPYWTA